MAQLLSIVQSACTEMLESMLFDVLTQAGKDVPGISKAKGRILIVFADGIRANFQALSSHQQLPEGPPVTFEVLVPEEHEESELNDTVEGMVAYARNEHLTSFISFNTRLNSVSEGNPIDEGSNPLDPEQIINAFRQSISSLNLNLSERIAAFRVFNAIVLRSLNLVLAAADRIFIENGIIPNLAIDGIGKPPQRARTGRSHQTEETNRFGKPEADLNGERQDEQPELFSLVQDLLRTTPSTSGQIPIQPPAGEPQSLSPVGDAKRVAELPSQGADALDRQQLIAILTDMQPSADQITARQLHGTSQEDGDGAVRPMDAVNIHQTLEEMLQQGQQDGSIAEVDQYAADVIHLVSMLYDVIWQDETVPLPINELIDMTQIAVIRVALADATFFDRENHPAKALLNEIAAAGIGWLAVDNLEEDIFYRKVQQLVLRIVTEYTDEIGFFEELLKDFRAFRSTDAQKHRQLEQRIRKARGGEARTRDAEDLVSQTIDERLLGRTLHPFVKDLLEGPWRRFMVMLVLKEGPGSIAWKQVIRTMDVLLWSVQFHEQAGDRERLESVNPRLLNNLRKAFRIASMDQQEMDSLIIELRKVQEASFGPVGPHETLSKKTIPQVPTAAPVGTVVDIDASRSARQKVEDSPQTGTIRENTTVDKDDSDVAEKFLREVDNFAVGLWVEFLGEDHQTVRCKLAARINTIDKLIFVNRQGVKVVETSREHLAGELQHGTVRVISDGLLFSRALESVIGDLRETKQTQQTGGAYRAPDPV